MFLLWFYRDKNLSKAKERQEYSERNAYLLKEVKILRYDNDLIVNEVEESDRHVKNNNNWIYEIFKKRGKQKSADYSQNLMRQPIKNLKRKKGDAGYGERNRRSWITR